MTDNDTTLSSERQEFERIWTAPTGFRGWFAAVNNQPFGNRFMIASFVFFMLAGIMALFMRTQLALPDLTIIGPDVYNQLFTMHGSTMMYLVILPFLEGLAIYIVPIAIGSREMAFPRMSAFSFWVFFSGGLIFFSGFLFNAVPDTGWFVYPPLSLSKFSGLGLDFLLVGLGFIEIAGVGAGIEIAVTILKLRAPGMSLGRMPVIAWAWLVTAIMIIFAFSTLFAATVLIELDRAIGTQFFNADGGGSPLLWQHLFWFFGHPDVYIMFIPATGMISMILPTFAKRPLAGYSLVVIATVMIGFVSFGLWVHHMFTTGLPLLSLGFFSASSLMIAIASGIQIFAWIGTLWRSSPAMKTPLLYILGFLFIFVIGGITGVMVAVVPFDWQVHDTYFVVAHFHYVLIGGVIFPVVAAVHYWLPLMIDRMPSERLGKWSFWLIFIGFNVTFFPMHLAGFEGMVRRVYTYPESLGIGWLNMMSTVGSFVLGIGFVVIAANIIWSRKNGAKAQRNPWGAGTLEFAVTAKMANYIFLRPPVVDSRHPLWDKASTSEARKRHEGVAHSLTGLPSTWRATLATDAVTGEPQAIQKVASPSYSPILAAIGMCVTSVATLGQSYLLALGALIFTLVVVAYWLWPKDDELKSMRTSDLQQRTGLPIEPTGTHATPWWAMVGLLCVLATIFGVLIYSYFYIQLYAPSWPLGGLPKPGLLLPGLAYGVLIGSAGPFNLAHRSLKKGLKTTSLLWTILSILMAAVGLALLTHCDYTAPFTPQTNAYASLFRVITWHVCMLATGGLAFLGAAALRLPKSIGKKDGYMNLQMQITGLYWYFSAAVLALIYLILYVSPYVL